MTVTVQVSEAPLAVVAVMVASPGASRIIRPDEETSTTSGSLDVQVISSLVQSSGSISQSR